MQGPEELALPYAPGDLGVVLGGAGDLVRRLSVKF